MNDPKCACVHWNARTCYQVRYGRYDQRDDDEQCECACHDDHPEYYDDEEAFDAFRSPEVY